ncbi:MAG: hypothetical protein PHQ50_01635 [Eubacteriales bacterium]|nr:hypothetical protein [Eubacteriales bacterium]
MQNRNPITGTRLIIGYVGVIIMLIGGIVMLPLLLLPIYPEEHDAAKYFIIPGVCAPLV